MANIILSETTASISELKKNPMGTVAAGEGAPVAILNRNQTAFYCIPPKVYEALIDRLEDIELNAIADARKDQPEIPVKLNEWSKLDSRLRDQIKKKLQERLIHPRVPASKLSGQKDRYKIKLRHVGYRLVYEVRDNERAVVVVAIGKRERNAVYKMAAKR